MTLKNLIVFIIFIPFSCLTFCQSSNAQSKIQKQRLLLQRTKDSVIMVNCLDTLGILYQYKNLDSCFYFASRAQALAKRIGFTKGEGLSTGLLGVNLYIRGLHKEALNTLNKAIDICGNAHDNAQIALDLISMANVYSATLDTLRAKSALRRAIQIANTLGKTKTAGLVYTSYCIYNLKLSQDSVTRYLTKAGSIAAHGDYQDLSLLIMEERIIRRIFSGNVTAILPLIDSAYAQAKKADLDFFVINSYNLYVEYYNVQNKPDSVLSYETKLYDLLKHKNYEYFKIPTLKIILQFTKEKGNPQKIAQVQRELNDALVLENHNLQKFVGDYLQYSNMQTENQLLTVTLNKDRLKILLLIGSCVVFVLGGLSIYHYYRLASRLNREVIAQNTQMIKTLSDLEQSQAENSQMMKIVAHDLRNPIGGIYSLASLMLENPARSEEDRMMLEMIKTSGKNSLTLVSDLLQMHTQGEQLYKEPINLRELLHYCVSLLMHKASAKAQHIELAETTLTVPVNREKMWRVISNLIANAIKFSPIGGHIFIRVERHESEALISVRDQGIGIPESIAGKIFDMFSDAKRAGTAGEQPFGMGLAISKQIVEAHGGRLWFEQVPSGGTVFHLTLPYV